MSYSSINDAFNINSKFDNTVRSLRTFNPGNSTMENINSAYGSNLNDSNVYFESNYFNNSKHSNNSNNSNNYSMEPNFEDYYNPNSVITPSSCIPSPIIDGMFANDNTSWESLNGTDLLSKPEQSNNFGKANTNRKLTHRECINIYNNPSSYKDTILTQGLRHVSKCELCKEEIKNNMILFENKNKSSENSKNNEKQINKRTNSNSSDSNTQNNIKYDTINNNQSVNKKLSETNSLFTNNDNVSSNNNLKSKIESSNSKIESELKILNEKINGETNIKYQNAMLQNNLSKYLEDLEEKKKINQKLDKIIEMVNINLTQCSKINTNPIYGEYSSFQSPGLLNSLPSQINSQLLNNLLKLNQENLNTNNYMSSSSSSNSNSTSFESYLLYMGICVIILLLIIDISLRFTTKNQ